MDLKKRDWALSCGNAKSTHTVDACSRGTGLTQKGFRVSNQSAVTTDETSCVESKLSPRSSDQSHTSTSFAEDSHVKTSASLARELASQVIEAAFGETSLGSSKKQNLGSLRSRTSDHSSTEACATFSRTLPLSGMMRSGSLCELNMSALRTAAKDSSLSRGERGKNWPTATRSDVKQGRRHGYMLDAVIIHGHHSQTMSTGGRRGSHKVVLNPDFVEALMGYPVGWTE